MSARPRFAPSLDWLPILLGQGSGVLCGLVGVRLVSSWVPAAILGVYGLFLVMSPIGSLFTHAGVAKHAAWYWPSAPDRRRYLREVAAASLLPGLCLAAITAACWGVATLAHVSWSSAPLWLCLLIANLGLAYTLVFQSSLQSARQYWSDASVTLVTSIGRTFLPLLFFAWLSPTLLGLTLGFACHAVLAGLWAYLALRRSLPATVPVTYVQTPGFAAFHRNFAAAGVLTVINTGMTRWVGARVFDPVELGYFTLASNLAMVLPNVLSGACWQYFFPRMIAAQQTPEGEARVIAILNRAMTLFLTVVVASGIVLRLLLPLLLGHLIDRSYAPALNYVLPIFAHGTSLAICYYYQGLLHAVGRPGQAVTVTAAATLLLSGGCLLAAAHSAHTFLLWLWISPIVVLLALRPLLLRLFHQTRTVPTVGLGVEPPSPSQP